MFAPEIFKKVQQGQFYSGYDQLHIAISTTDTLIVENGRVFCNPLRCQLSDAITLEQAHAQFPKHSVAELEKVRQDVMADVYGPDNKDLYLIGIGRRNRKIGAWIK